MDLLAECLSISRIEPGETIVQDRRRAAASVARRVPRAPAETRARRSPPPQEGEQGTWIGILLRGGLEVIIGGKPVFHVDPGNFVGEMILWAGGVRQVSHTPPPPCSYAPAWLTGRVPGVFVAQASVRASGEGVIAMRAGATAVAAAGAAIPRLRRGRASICGRTPKARAPALGSAQRDRRSARVFIRG